MVRSARNPYFGVTQDDLRLARCPLKRMSIRARVSHRRLVVDEPVDLPEGTVLDIVIDDEEDGLDDEERLALHASRLDEHRQH